MNLWSEQEGALRLIYPDGSTVSAGYSAAGWQHIEADFLALTSGHTHWQTMFPHASLITFRTSDRAYFTIHNERIIGYRCQEVSQISNQISELELDQTLSQEAINMHPFYWREEEVSKAIVKRFTLGNMPLDVMVMTTKKRATSVAS